MLPIDSRTGGEVTSDTGFVHLMQLLSVSQLGPHLALKGFIQTARRRGGSSQISSLHSAIEAPVLIAQDLENLVQCI